MHNCYSNCTYMHDYGRYFIYYFTFFLSRSPHSLIFNFSLSPLSLSLSLSLSLLSLVPQSSLTNTISIERRREKRLKGRTLCWWYRRSGKRCGQLWRFFRYRTRPEQWHLGLGESEPWRIAESGRASRSCYYLDFLWGLKLQRLLWHRDLPWVLANHACTAEVWHFFGLNFL